MVEEDFVPPKGNCSSQKKKKSRASLVSVKGSCTCKWIILDLLMSDARKHLLVLIWTKHISKGCSLPALCCFPLAVAGFLDILPSLICSQVEMTSCEAALGSFHLSAATLISSFSWAGCLPVNFLHGLASWAVFMWTWWTDWLGTATPSQQGGWVLLCSLIEV